jgi:threonine dehydrogenase-like Zn-dependent dehydrogenase
VQTILELTRGIGVDRVIDAVGVDAERAHEGPAKVKGETSKRFDRVLSEVTGGQPGQDREHWRPGDGPSQVLEWAIESLDKAGTLAIIGVYPPTMRSFPIGQALNKNLTIQMGNCNHRRYMPMLLDLVSSGAIDPVRVLTQVEPMTDIIEAYMAFDDRRAGWTKVAIEAKKK